MQDDTVSHVAFARLMSQGLCALGSSRMNHAVSVPHEIETPRARASKPLWWMVILAVYAGLALASGLRTSPDMATMGTALVLGGILVCLSVEDMFTLRLPDLGTLTLIGAGLVWCAIFAPGDLAHNATAAAVGFGTLYLIAAGYIQVRGQHGLGLGDAKLFAASGAWLGLEGLQVCC